MPDRKAKARALARLAVACLCLGAAWALGQDQAPYQPQVGQEGKDVVWVPTPDRLITRMLQMADTTSADLVVDLGRGDGRIPIAAAVQFGAQGLGVEFDPNLVHLSTESAARAGVSDRVRFLRQDLFQTDLAAATVVALYVSPGVMDRLRPKLMQTRPGTRIVSHQFTLGDWEPDEQAIAEGRNAYLWVVPANAQGRWRLSFNGQEYVIDLQQTHQMLRGTAESGGRPSPVFAARLRGTAIRFAFVDRNGDPRAFTGRIAGNSMDGTSRIHDRPESPWSARRD